MAKQFKNQHAIHESLDKIAEHLEEEARMVLPGIQALFGFQMVAVFNQRFEQLSTLGQTLHLAALLCTTVSILLILTPAAFHRQSEPAQISTRFCELGSKLLTASLFPLAVGISLDLYVICTLLTKSSLIPILVSLFTCAAFIWGWFGYPQTHKLKTKGDE